MRRSRRRSAERPKGIQRLRLTVAGVALGMLFADLVGIPQQSFAAVTTAWTFTVNGPNLSPEIAAQPYAGAAVGDIDNDGRNDVVAGFMNGQVYAFNSAGSVLPGWPRSVEGAVHSAPTLSDLNGDGDLEVIVASECNQGCFSPPHGYVYVFHPDGTLFPGWPQKSQGTQYNFPEGWFGSVAVGDLFGTGQKQLVAGSWDHFLYVWDINGRALPGWPRNLWDTIWASPVLTDLDKDGQLEIVQGGDMSGMPDQPYPAGGTYWAFRANGSEVPGWPRLTDQVPWASPAAVSLSNDGTTDIVAGSGHYWSGGNSTCPTGCGKEVTVFRQDGSQRYRLPTGGTNFGSPAVGDLLRNGRNQIVQPSSDGKVYAWGDNGALLPGWPVNPGQGQLLSAASIGPVDGSGYNGVWVAAGAQLRGYSRSGALVQNIGFGAQAYNVAQPTIANLGGDTLSAVTISQPSAGNINQWTLHVVPIPGATSMPAGAWPTARGNNDRTGSLVPRGTPQAGLGAPDATTWGPGRLDVFARGADNTLRHKWLADGRWNSWESLGGSSQSDPSAAAWGAGRLDTFVRGTDNQLWHKWYENGWSRWESLGGALASGPDATSPGPGRLNVVAKGTDGQLWHKSYDRGWSPWQPLGGAVVGDPTVVASDAGRLDVFVRGTDNQLWHRWYVGGGWSRWESLGGNLVSGPDAASWGPGHLDVYAKGADGQLWHRFYSGGWSNWTPEGASPQSDATAAAWAPGRVDVFTRGPDQNLWHKWYQGGWAGWERLGIF